MICNKRPSEQLEEFLLLYSEINPIDIDKARQLIKDARAHYDKKSVSKYQVDLEVRWYDSIEQNNPDYSIYDDEYYFTDLWVCWVLFSRGYLRTLIHPKSLNENARIYDLLMDTKSILDLGCGLGYTTATLKQIFNKAKVFATNLEGTKQYIFCAVMSAQFDFKLVPDISHIRQDIDLVFASEYF